jgi:hypothetical protein
LEAILGYSISFARQLNAQAHRIGKGGGASYVVKKESKSQRRTEKDGNREDGDGGVLRFLKKLIPDIHAV